jgi:uncharacterized Zn-binding protein involved in type VI secretion
MARGWAHKISLATQGQETEKLRDSTHRAVKQGGGVRIFGASALCGEATVSGAKLLAGAEAVGFGWKYDCD